MGLRMGMRMSMRGIGRSRRGGGGGGTGGCRLREEKRAGSDERGLDVQASANRQRSGSRREMGSRAIHVQLK
jgi:hypothetical protein